MQVSFVFFFFLGRPGGTVATALAPGGAMPRLRLRWVLLTLAMGALILVWQRPPPPPSTSTAVPRVSVSPNAAMLVTPAISEGPQTTEALLALPPSFWLPETIAPASVTVVSRCGPAPGPASGQESLNPIQKPTTCPRELDGIRLSACKISTSHICTEGELLLLGVADGARRAADDSHRLQVLITQLRMAKRAVGSRLLLICSTHAEAELAQRLDIGWWHVPSATGEYGATSALWRATAALLRVGVAVIASPGSWVAPAGIASDTTIWLANPWTHISRDVDVEAAQLAEVGGKPDRGMVVGTSDPPMGWSAYAQTMTTPLLDPTVVALQPTEAAFELANAFSRALAMSPSLEELDGYLRAYAQPRSANSLTGPVLWAAWQLTRLVLQPAYDAQTRPGASLRILRRDCFVHMGSIDGILAEASTVAAQVATREVEKVATAVLRPGFEEAGAQSAVKHIGGTSTAEMEAPAADPQATGPSLQVRFGDANEILDSLDWRASERRILEGHGCRALNASLNSPRPRPAQWVVPIGETWPSQSSCSANEDMRELCMLVEKIAIDREILVAVSNRNILPMLQLFLRGLQAAGIHNSLVTALDETTANFVHQQGGNAYVRRLRSHTGSTDNHATSGLKFAVLLELVSIGASVLLSDVDVLWLQNPCVHVPTP